MPAEGERFARVRRVFEEALGIGGTSRLRWLDYACAGDADLRAEVEELLAVDAAADPTGDGLLPRRWLQNRLDQALDGARIGPFRLVRLLASGGMGAVYEAEQDEPRRRVALKLLRAGDASQRAIQRFRFEADLLARMQHDNIARVFASGVHEEDVDGERVAIPYFAIELVENAVTLLSWARTQGLDRAARIRLFLQVCDAVEHGHRRGVLHRDLKPHNVLVGADGRVKVIDFGIARPLDRDPAYDWTRTRETAGTLRYMSPEQLAGSDLDPSSDVFALGVVLHELLLDKPPRAPADDLLAGQDPLAAESGVDAPNLPRELRWILMRALARDREQRYPTALMLGDDLRRHLADLPVSAGPPGAGYRLRKFVRRHRVGVAAAALATVGLIATSAVAVAGFFEARQQREVALARAREAEATLRLFADALTAAIPGHEGSDATLRDFLEATASALDTADAEVPAMAVLHRTLGFAFESLGELPRAVRHLERAVELMRTAGTASSDELLELQLRVGGHLHQLGETERAVEMLGAVAAAAVRDLGPEHAVAFAASSAFASALLAASGVEAALPLFTDLAARAERRFGSEHQETMAHLNNLASALTAAGRLPAAEAIAARVADRMVERFGLGHGDAMVAVQNLAAIRLRLGRAVEAEDAFRAVLAEASAAWGEHHPETARTRHWLGRALLEQGRAAEAVPVLDGALVDWRTACGERHDLTGQIELALAAALRSTGDEARARAVASGVAERFAGESTAGRADLVARARAFLDGRAR
jgi:tetratricopeptide (TPR) repeat protein